MEPLRRDAARNRQRIAEAARRVAARGEPLAFHAVAREAEVGVGTVYRHFASAEELEEAVVRDRFDVLGSLLADADPAGLDRALTAHFALLAEDTLFEKVVARSEPALPETRVIRDSLVARLSELLQGAQASGGVRADIDGAGVLLLLCGLAHSARSAGLPAGSAQADALLGVLLDGLRAGAPAPEETAATARR